MKSEMENAKSENEIIESDLNDFMEELRSCGFISFTNKRGDIISVKGMLIDIIKRLKLDSKEREELTKKGYNEAIEHAIKIVKEEMYHTHLKYSLVAKLESIKK